MHQPEQLVDPVGDLVLGALADLETEGDVLGHGHVLEHGVVLEHEAHVALLRRQPGGVGALDGDRAGVGLLEARDDAQQGGLAPAAGAEQGGELTRRDGHVDVLQRDEVAEPLVHPRDFDAHGWNLPWVLRRERDALATGRLDCGSIGEAGHGWLFGRMMATMTMQATETIASRNAIA